MLAHIRRMFSVSLQSEEVGARPSLELAAAALLMEVARADLDVDAAEEGAIGAALEQALGLSHDEVESLMELAHEHSREAIALHPFTSVINAGFDAAEKRALFERLWRVAYADGRLDKYEEHLLRRIADLLHVPHSDFIRTKLRALEGDDGTTPRP